MEPREAAVASGDSINGLGSHFMIDLNTYVRGAELGYEGVDFYVAGRGGVLGDVPADAVVDAFVHFEPTSISDAWERTASHPRLTSAQEFADVCHDWADAKIPDDVDCARIAELAGKLADHAATVIDPAVAPLFFGWRALPEPGADRPKALALHRLNGLREMRGALHGAAVRAQGITSRDAVKHRTPYMLAVFGWADTDTPVADDVPARWEAAQAATEDALVPAYEGLTLDERAEFTELVNHLQARITGAA